MKKHSKFLEKWNPDKYNTNHLSDLLCTPYVPNLSHHFTLETKSLSMVFSQIIMSIVVFFETAHRDASKDF